MKTAAILALFVAVATASSEFVVKDVSIFRKSASSAKGSILGVVGPISLCGGTGVFSQLRITDCEGYCYYNPGTNYVTEVDFQVAASTTSVRLLVELRVSGTSVPIIDTVINASLFPGLDYTLNFSFIPNAGLGGQNFDFQINLSNAVNNVVEICVSAIGEVTANSA